MLNVLQKRSTDWITFDKFGAPAEERALVKVEGDEALDRPLHIQAPYFLEMDSQLPEKCEYGWLALSNEC